MPQFELNFRDYWRIFRKRRIIIITILLATSLGGLYQSSRQVVYYQSSATIKISERKSIAGLLTEMIVYNPADLMETETKIIKGYSVAKKVALKFNNIKEEDSIEKINQAVAWIQSDYETEKIANTNMIRIIATGTTPENSMILANTVSNVYIEENLSEKVQQFRTVRKFIEEQLVTLEVRLSKAEDELKQFGSEVQDINMSEPIQQKLINLEFQLADLMQKYTEKHPLVIQLKEQIAELEKQVTGFSGKEVQYARLNREVEINRKLYAMLKERLEEARITEAQKVPDVTIVNPAPRGHPISADKKTIILTGILLGLVLGSAIAFAMETFDTSISTIEDVENVIKLPVLGVVPSVESEIEQKLGVIKRLKNRFSKVAGKNPEEKYFRLYPHYKPSSPDAESYRNIYANLKISPTRKTILITSSSPREGKSSVVCGLAIVIAQLGLKTLIVSCDLRRPVIDKTFGVSREPGVHEFIMGSANLEESLRNVTDIMLGDIPLEDIRKTPGIENIWILPSGKLISNPTEILENSKFDDLIVSLRARFDVVIFDSPPVLPVADTSLFASKVDSCIIVYEIGRTSREALMRTKMQLETSGAKIAGVVLNHISPQTEIMSAYPYYHYKYKYYTKEPPKMPQRPSRIK